MKPQLLLPERRLKTVNFTLVCLGVVSSFKLAFFLSPVLQASNPPSPSSKSNQTLSKPVQQAGVKSSTTTSTGKKVASRSKKRRKVTQGQRTIESSRVLEIQGALAVAGYYKAAPNGEWDDSTSKAMSAYQQDNGFRTTGKPDALSLKKLGL